MTAIRYTVRYFQQQTVKAGLLYLLYFYVSYIIGYLTLGLPWTRDERLKEPCAEIKLTVDVFLCDRCTYYVALWTMVVLSLIRSEPWCSRTLLACRKLSTSGSCLQATSYKESILLPRTSFPARIEGKKRADADEKIISEPSFQSLYKRQLDRVSEYVHMFYQLILQTKEIKISM